MSQTLKAASSGNQESVVNGSAVKERPILFSGPMVRAILAGDKLQTRRVVKNSDDVQGWAELELFPPIYRGWWSSDDETAHASYDINCPYGNVGDVLWVRETIKRAGAGACWFAADDQPVYGTDELTGVRMLAHYKYKRAKLPSIHMPKDWCRLFLRIAGIRIERLQQISGSDAAAEGIERDAFDQTIGFKDYLTDDWHVAWGETSIDQAAIQSFRSLWESINGEGSWDANPWVWVIEFEKI